MGVAGVLLGMADVAGIISETVDEAEDMSGLAGVALVTRKG